MKNIFSIQNLRDGSWQVNMWDDDKKKWIGVSTNYIYLGNAIRFIEKHCGEEG